MPVFLDVIHAGHMSLMDDSQDMTPFRARLHKMSELRGLRQSEIGRRMGKPRQTVSKYFTGESLPSMDSVFALADAIGISARWLATGEGRPFTYDPQASAGDPRAAQMLTVFNLLDDKDRDVALTMIEALHSRYKIDLTGVSRGDGSLSRALQNPGETWDSGPPSNGKQGKSP